MTATSTGVSALVSFLLARIDDDEAQITRLLRSARTKDTAGVAHNADSVTSLTRIRLECRAKRKIIGAAQQLVVFRDLPNEHQVREEAWRVLRALAAPYAQHVSYRPDWV